MRPAAFGEAPVILCPVSRQLVSLTIEILDAEKLINAKEIELSMLKQFHAELIRREKSLRARLPAADG